MSPAKLPGVTIVGAGRLGTALACRLADAGFPLAHVASRRIASARRATRLAGSGRATASLRRAGAAGKITLLAVPDDALAGVAAALAAAAPWGARVALHTCGSRGPGALDPLSRAGAAVGVFHPLQTFPGGAPRQASLTGVRAAMQGDPPALREARRLARALGMKPLVLPPGREAAYHLAASLASNALVALVDAAAEALGRTGANRDDAVAALLPLIRGAVDALDREGLPGALTGPVARGDRETVALHLEALRAMPRDVDELYRLLARRALRLARESGTTQDRALRSLARLLRSRSR